MMDQELNPCYECGERKVGCHGTCKRWKQAREQRAQKREKRNAAKKAEQDYYAFQSECYRMTLREVQHRKI